MSSPPPSQVGEASTSRQRSRSGNGNGNGNGNESSSSRSRRRRRRRPPTPPLPQQVVIEEASTSAYYNMNGGVWPEPFVESLTIQVAVDASSSFGRLAVAPALALLFQVLSPFSSFFFNLLNYFILCMNKYCLTPVIL